MPSSVQTRCESIASDLSRKWEWDDFFRAALLTYPVADEPEILGVIGKELPQTWTSENISEAPELIQELAAAFRGLRPGQRILSSAAIEGSVLFVTIWPWADGATASLRLGCLSPVPGEGEDHAPNPRVKAWFQAV